MLLCLPFVDSCKLFDISEMQKMPGMPASLVYFYTYYCWRLLRYSFVCVLLKVLLYLFSLLKRASNTLIFKVGHNRSDFLNRNSNWISVKLIAVGCLLAKYYFTGWYLRTRALSSNVGGNGCWSWPFLWRAFRNPRIKRLQMAISEFHRATWRCDTGRFGFGTSSRSVMFLFCWSRWGDDSIDFLFTSSSDQVKPKPAHICSDS